MIKIAYANQYVVGDASAVAIDILVAFGVALVPLVGLIALGFGLWAVIRGFQGKPIFTKRS